MKLTTITWTHIRRSPYQAFAAVLTMFLTFLVSGFFFVTSVGSVLVLKYFEGKPQITVFFTDKTGVEEAKLLEEQLKATGKVAAVTYVSKEEALASYQEQNKNDPLLLEMVTADILPSSLEISATDPSFLHELEPIIKQSPGVDEVVFLKDIVDALLMWTSAIRLVGTVLAGILAINALLVVMTIIGMKIALKKSEVEILTLIGASPWYIRLPFIFEGGIYGIVGALWAWTCIAGSFFWLRQGILSFLGIVPVMAEFLRDPLSSAFLIPVFALLAIMTAVGFLLGGIGSFIAVSRYL